MISAHRLPRTQKEALGQILHCAENNDMYPTFKELALMLKLKSNVNARRVVMELEAKGLVSLVRGSNKRVVSRSVRPTEAAWDWWKAQEDKAYHLAQAATTEKSAYIPEEAFRILAEGAPDEEVSLIGQVAAGQPTLTEQVTSNEISLVSLFRGRDLFMLKVTGDSMIGDHIVKGDYVVVSRDAELLDGEMVVAVVNDEATVKRLWRHKDTFRLESSNPEYEPIRIRRGDNSFLLGKVIGVVRDQIQRRYRNSGD